MCGAAPSTPIILSLQLPDEPNSAGPLHVDPGSLEELDKQSDARDILPSSVDEHGDGLAFQLDAEENLMTEDTGVSLAVKIEELSIANCFIDALQNADLENSGLHPNVLERLRSPPQEIADIDDHIFRLSLDIYLGLNNASENHYDRVRTALLCYDPALHMLSLDQIKRRAQEISGIYPVYHDMCVNGCLAFVGPFADLDTCKTCKESHYKPGEGKKPRQQFLTNPIGPQVQASWRSPESTAGMSYCRQCTDRVLADFKANGNRMSELSDWVHGEEYIQAASDGRINEHTTTLLLSLDGAQLYCSKQSDCWIYIWVLLDQSPET